MVQAVIEFQTDEEAARILEGLTLQVEVSYSRQVQDQPAVMGQARATLEGGRGRITLADAAPASELRIDYISDWGLSLHTRATSVPDDGNLVISLDGAAAEQVARVPEGPEEPKTPATRAGVFVPVGETKVAFGMAKLEVAPLPSAAEWAGTGLDTLLGNALPTTSAVEVVKYWPGYSLLSWTPVHLRVDGQFTAQMTAEPGSGWVWWMSGPQQALGFVADELDLVPSRRVAIALPSFTRAAPGDRYLPADVTEAELVDNPEVFQEDPGQDCRPFQNPERILGERRFHVIHRAEQPAISAEATTRLIGPTIVDPQPPARTAKRSVFSRWFRRQATAALPVTLFDPPIMFVPKLPPNLLAALAAAAAGRTATDARSPLQWEADAARSQATTVARGHILEFAMRWYSDGYSLGSVAATLTLAPRQVKRVQKIQWERLEAARRTEGTRLADTVEDEIRRNLDYEDQVRAGLAEWASGNSTAAAAAASGGFGFALPGVIAGGGGTSTSASSESSMSGGRDVTAAEDQRLRDATRRYADSLRQLDSTVVTEVEQGETVTGTTEVVRNFNYAHSLTVIYYEILRHLKVTTELAGVRECLFVPLAVTSFDLARAYRWRDSIRLGLREQRFAPALRNLYDVLTDFANSDVPDGPRSAQPIRHISGSVFIQLGVQRPRDATDEAFDSAAWQFIEHLLGSPAIAIHAQLKEQALGLRDRLFQREHAPGIAGSWANRLQLRLGGQQMPADFTLATSYQFNRQVRVDFSLPIPAGQLVNRQMLTSLSVHANDPLTPGSVANLTRITLDYQTDTFRRTVTAAQGANDLILTSTGETDANGAEVSLPLDPWEGRDERREMRRAVNDLVAHLNEHVEHYHKSIWWNMDRDRLFMLMDGIYLPFDTKISVASVVEREPVTIIGNCLVYRVSAGSFLGMGALKTKESLRAYYNAGVPLSDPLSLATPTGGLYARTIMDECSALEEHFGNHDWALADRDLEPAALELGALQSRRQEPEGLQPTPFPQTIINLQQSPEAPAPSGLAGVLAALGNANAFRDMTGLAGTQENAQAALQAAAGLANAGLTGAASRLTDLAAKAQATQTADQKLASIKKAAEKDLITAQEAQQHADKVLGELHTAPGTSPRIRTPASPTRSARPRTCLVARSKPPRRTDR